MRSILNHLDLRSLCSFACVSTASYRATRDPHLFTAVNLKSYWPFVNRSTLEWLAVRSRLLHQLDLSWCGSYGKLNAEDFNIFLKRGGHRLNILRLENCRFLNNDSLYWMSTVCTDLQELSLRGCRHVESSAFWHLGRLKKLQRLVLDGTLIELPTLLVNLQSLTSLCHLSVGSCAKLAQGGSLDEISRWLARYQPHLESLVTY